MTQVKKCSRCNGTGKVGFTIDDGICYKCEGAGFVGGTEDEINAAIAEKKSRTAKSKSVELIVKHLSKNSATTLEDMAINLKGETKEYFLGASIADLFDVPFIDNYSYVFTCTNPSSWMLKNREMLNGKIAIIEKIADRKLRITINAKSN